MCTKSIGDFDYIKHSKGTLINVDVKEELKIEDESRNHNRPARSKTEQGNYGDVTVVKTMDLNQSLTDEMLNSIEIDDKLAHLLMMQDESIEDHAMLNF